MIKNMEIDTEHYDLSDDLKQRIQDKIAGLDEYMDTLDRGHVTVSWEGGPNEQTRIRAEVWGPGQRFDASDTDWKAITAIDKTHSKLESQIRRVHEKSISKRDHNRH
ncbi:MAG: ribosome-associated translation inhibitor RaiA [Actinomycetia bacterium]|nr:ribosome-associated translation inhibitor RaiA [Actinomycetes bacterium]